MAEATNPIADDLRRICREVRVRPYPIADIIPTLQKAADALEQPDKEIEMLQAANKRFAQRELVNMDRMFELEQQAGEIERLRAENAELRAHIEREHIDSAQTVEDAAAVVRENAELRKEIATLRMYGNKDCTAMADAAMEGP